MKALIFLVSLVISVPAPADPLQVKTESPSKLPPGAPAVTLTVDEAFTTKNENTPPPVPFRVTAPKDKDLRVMAGGRKTGVPELLRLTLPSADGKQAVEILRFGALNLPAGAKEARIKAAAELLKTKAFPMFTNGFEDPKALETYVTRVAGYDAVCLHISMAKPGGKPAYLVKAVAILNPDAADGVMGFLMADRDLSEVKAAADLASKGVGLQILHSVKFLPKP